MVGVPGRSKGCKTCRDRRKLCDKQRPQCNQCVRLGLDCPGYERELIFIAAHGAAKEDAERMRSTLREVRSKATRQLSLRSPPTSSADATPLTSFAPSTAISPRASYQQQLLSFYIQRCIPLQKIGSPDSLPWMALLPDYQLRSTALAASCMAICTASLGRSDDDPLFVQESLKFYTQSLWELRLALSDPVLACRDETLGACTAMAMYEFMECPSGTRHGYYQHHVGCGKLIEMRGPEAFTGGLAHRLFVSFRAREALHALDARSTFLSGPQWMHTPWRFYSKNVLHRLLDVFMLGPAILKSADTLSTLKSYALARKILELIDDLTIFGSKYQNFYDQLEQTTDGPVYWEVPASGVVSADDDGFDGTIKSVYIFPNLELAFTLMLYWAGMAQVRSGILGLYTLLAWLEIDPADAQASTMPLTCPPQAAGDGVSESRVARFDMTTLPPLGERANFIEMARKVLKSVHYCCGQEMMKAGQMVTIGPLHMTIDVLKTHPQHAEELRLATKALGNVCDAGVLILKAYGRLE